MVVSAFSRRVDIESGLNGSFRNHCAPNLTRQIVLPEDERRHRSADLRQPADAGWWSSGRWRLMSSCWCSLQPQFAVWLPGCDACPRERRSHEWIGGSGFHSTCETGPRLWLWRAESGSRMKAPAVAAAQGIARSGWPRRFYVMKMTSW